MQNKKIHVINYYYTLGNRYLNFYLLDAGQFCFLLLHICEVQSFQLASAYMRARRQQHRQNNVNGIS